MAESVFFKPLSLAFSIVTLIESFIWAVLSFLSILCYNDIIKYDNNTNYGLNIFMQNLYNLYLSENTFSTDERAINPDIFYTLMWIYFLLSLFLCFASGVHISILTQKSNVRKVNLSTIIGLALVYLVCLYDFITCIIFGVDYHLVRKTIKIDTPETEVIVAVILTFVVLSMKGFVLWIFNFVFAIVITIIFKSKVAAEPILGHGPEIQARNKSVYDAFGGSHYDEIHSEMKNDENNQDDSNGEGIGNDYISVTTSPWYTQLSGELSRQNYAPTISQHSSISRANTWTHIPRTSSFRQPRSLAASLTPSPVPLPSRETHSAGRRSAPPQFEIDRYSSGYRTDTDRRNHDDDDNDSEVEDDEVSLSRISMAYPKISRFNLDEPEPDYAKI